MREKSCGNVQGWLSQGGYSWSYSQCLKRAGLVEEMEGVMKFKVSCSLCTVGRRHFRLNMPSYPESGYGQYGREEQHHSKPLFHEQLLRCWDLPGCLLDEFFNIRTNGNSSTGWTGGNPSRRHALHAMEGLTAWTVFMSLKPKHVGTCRVSRVMEFEIWWVWWGHCHANSLTLLYFPSC
jgi:hypothetical protein